MRLRTGISALLIMGAAPLVAAPAARADAVLTGSTLAVTGTAADETYAVGIDGAKVVVTGPSIASDPDLGGSCVLVQSGKAECVLTAVDQTTVDAGDGKDTLVDNTVGNLNLVVQLHGGLGDDGLTAGVRGSRLQGNEGADKLVGGPADDILDGGAGNDDLAGGGGSDQLSDGDFTLAVTDSPQPTAGNDRLDGGPDNDELISDRGADDLIGGSGVDEAVFARLIPQGTAVTTPALPAPFTVSLDDVANDGQSGANEGDNVHSDVEDVVTDEANDVVTGSAASNDLDTGDGNDVVTPGAGADLVFAGRGDDTVLAQDEYTDVIDCGLGTDTASLDLAGAQPARADVANQCETIGGVAFPAVRLISDIPPPPPPPDTTAPTLTLSSKTITTKSFLKAGALPVSVTCSEGCAVTGEVFTTGVKLAKVGQLSIGSGSLKTGTGKRTITLKVAKKYLQTYKRRLRTKTQKRKGVSFVVTLTAKDAAGNQKTASRTVKVKN